MKKQIILLAITLATSASSFAQLGTPLSQFSGNQMVYNPAYAGIYDLLSVNLSVHKSWLSLPGSPQQIALNGHAPFLNEKHGWGYVYQHEKWGPLTGNFTNGTYSYKMFLSEGVLSFGLQAGILVHTVDWDAVEYVDSRQDPFLGKGRVNSVKFDANVGIYYLAPQWYAGFSGMHLNNPRYDIIDIGGTEWFSQMRSQFFFVAGYNIEGGHLWSFRPEMFVRFVKTTPVSVNAGLHAVYENKHSVGVNFMTGQKGVSFQAKFSPTDRLRIGYSYDVFYGPIKSYQHGSHEISVNYLLRDVWNKTRTIDLMWL
jgi:type IX secretion system PorP/SprF family membrane protein